MRLSIFVLILGMFCCAAAVGGDACAPASCEQAARCVDPDCCHRCGCKMACKVECYTKEVKKTEWVVKCEPYCAPLPGCGRECCQQAGECLCKCDPCAVELAKAQVPPKCGPVKERKILEKKEITCKVPTYRCVPTCPSCGATGKAQEIEGGKPAGEKAAPAETKPAKTAAKTVPADLYTPLVQMSVKK
jgi:hypothetical protein